MPAVYNLIYWDPPMIHNAPDIADDRKYLYGSEQAADIKRGFTAPLQTGFGTFTVSPCGGHEAGPMKCNSLVLKI